MLPYFICLFLLVLPGGTENSIEFKIEISKSGFPTISMDIGNQKSRKLLLSLYSPMIIAFPYQNLPAHYEKANSSTYKSLDITAQFPNINAAQEDYKVMISEEKFTINNNLNVDLKFGSIIIENFKCPDSSAGVAGLIRNTEGLQNLENKYLFINQLYEQKKISQKLFYIAPYYKDTEIIESKLILGSYPKEFNLSQLPYCNLDNTYSKNYLDCRLDEIIIEDGNNITRSQVYKGRHIVARFEEGSIQPNQLPYYLYPTFKEILVTQKGCVESGGFFDCSKKPEVIKNFKVSYVFGGYKYTMNTNSIWLQNKLSFKFPKETSDKYVILFSSFSGNYHRIYSMDDQRVYYAGINNNIIKLDDNSKPNSDNKGDSSNNNKKEKNLWFIISMILIVILIIVTIIIIVLVIKVKHKNDLANINKVSFIENNE